MGDEEELDDAGEDDFGLEGSSILGVKRQELPKWEFSMACLQLTYSPLELFCCLSSFITMFCAAIAMQREFDILVPNAQKNGIPTAVSMPFIGDLIGAVMAMPMLHILGRKASLMVGHVLFIVPSVGVAAGLSPGVESYLIIFIHMATRYFLITFAVYFAEVTDRWLRGVVISSRYFLYDTGHFLAAHAFEKSTTGCILVVVLQLFSLGMTLLLPETPYYLALTGNREEAETQFDWLRGGAGDPDEGAIMANRAETDAENAAEGLPFGTKNFLMPLLVVLCMELGVLGSIPISYYVQTYIEHIHYYRPYIDFGDILFGTNRFVVREEFLMLTMKLLATFLVAVLPRRILYLAIVFISMICCTSYMYAGVNTNLIYQVVTAYKFVILLGGEQLSHVTSSEIFPGIFRAFGVSFGQLFQSILDFLTIYSLHVPEHMDTFVLVCFGLIPFGFIMSFIFMPETFGMTLSDAEDTGGYIVLGLFKNYLVNEEEESVAEE